MERKRYCIAEKNLTEFHAGSKARNDVATILKKDGWEEIYVTPITKRKDPNALDKVKSAVLLKREWAEIAKKFPSHSTLLIQYPLDMFPRVAPLAVKYIQKIKEKDVEIIFLIHDLDSLREPNPKRREWVKATEKRFLELGKKLIVHNNRMKEYFDECGLTQEKIPLELFDYLLDFDVEHRDNSKKNSIVIAGNLKMEKAQYVYKLNELGGDIDIYLYGPAYTPQSESPNIHYEGAYPPDQLVKVMKGSFGLVWDGVSIESCEGAYGEYMKYNNPHKASLYIAGGLPVIINKDAAIAEFILKNNLGITISSLKEIPERLSKMSDEEFEEMKSSVALMGAKLRRGDMLGKVLKKINN